MDFWTEIVSEKNLKKAWDKVHSQNSAPGIDGLSVSGFALNADSLLAEVREELCSGTFSFSVVKICSIQSGSKKREIGLCTVRDKIVQNSIAAVLQAHFEPYLSPAAHAYRQGKSANQAVHKVRNFFQQGYTFAFKGDIENFFDSIDHEIMINQLEAYEVGNKTLDLIRKALCTNLFRDMDLHSLERGTVQGSALSPLLSNIYLMPLDQTLCSGPWKFVRYSDDFVLLANSASSLEVGRHQLDIQLAKLKLKIHPQKSFSVDAQQGFDFLGFRVSMNEFLPASKSLQHLENILCETLARGEEAKAEQEWLGWINFFGYPELEPRTPEVFLFLLSHARDAKDISRLISFRAGISVSNVEWLLKAAGEWLRLGCKEEAYLEYARFRLEDSSRIEGLYALNEVFNERTAEVIDILKSVVLGQATKEQWSILAEIYGDIGEYALAKAALSYSLDTPEESFKTAFAEQDNDSLFEDANIENDVGGITYDDKIELTSQDNTLHKHQNNINPEKEELANSIDRKTVIEDPADNLINKLNWDFLAEDLERAVELFSGREGISALEQVDEKGYRRFTLREEPLTAIDFHRHLKGEFSLGIYLVRANETVKFAVIDIDISRQVLLKSPDKSVFAAYKQDALTDVKQLIAVARQENLSVTLEDSGNRGYHLWFFFTEPIPAEQARRLLSWLTRQCAPVSDHITREVFPKEKRMVNSYGSVIKLPLGIHSLSGRRSLFLTHDGEVAFDQPGVLRSISMTEPELVQSILAKSTGHESNLLADMSQRQATKEKLLPKEWANYPVVSSVLNHCLLLKYFSLKALEFKYLQHQERLAILQTFAHLGQEGKDMIHRVMEECLNYNSQTTERFISRVLPKPISCPRLRGNFPELTSALGCDCRFRLPSKAYPSPVLHALGISGHKVELPAIQENTKGFSQEDRLKVEGLVKRLSELRKQERGIQKAIDNVENTLSVIFKDKEINEMDLSIGTLVYLRQDGEERWVINL